jgi:phthalate 4,5-dioxygenase oxygenase subunit
MLSEADNELLTRIGRDTPMGDMMRRYWMPICLAEEVAEPDGDPVTSTVLGERLVVFRDSFGGVGVLREGCPHRRASLAIGRNEEGGLRCIYHGWKFDRTGACIDMPSEPPGSTFLSKLRNQGYPTREAGGIIWSYLGPADKEPVFPQYDWITAPAETRALVKVGQRANYLQALEGSIDSSHSWFLHRGTVMDWEKRTSVSTDTSPRMEVEDTDYGFRYAAVRTPNLNPDTKKYVRVTLWAFPFISMIPRPEERQQPYLAALFVPVDDERTMMYSVFVGQDGSPLSTHAIREENVAVPGIDLDSEWFRLGQPMNRYLQDRAAMRAGNWTGIRGFIHQDAACSESMGAIADRTDEHLGQSDRAITRVRRRLLESVRRTMQGDDPIGVTSAIPFGSLRSGQFVIQKDESWQHVLEGSLA